MQKDEKLLNREFKYNFPLLPKDLLKVLRASANQGNFKRIAIVGGVLRDNLIHLICNEKIQEVHDLDLIVEGSAEELAEIIKSQLGNDRVLIKKVNSEYKTVELKVDNLLVDIAMARTEKYAKPAQNPEIHSSYLENDLYRRDFTINAIALDLGSNQIIDLYKGMNSISNRELLFIHSKSVEEDPSRVIRAARYAARLDFNLDKKSLEQVQSTIKKWPWGKTLSIKSSPPALATRLRMELEILFEKENWFKAIEFLQKWGALRLLDENIQKDRVWKKRIYKAINLKLSPLTALISIAINPILLAERLQLDKNEKIILYESIEIKKHFIKLNDANKSDKWLPSDWCDEIESHNWKENSIALAICIKTPFWKYLFIWLKKWKNIKSEKSAKELIKNGWEEGPELGKELKRLRKIELNKN